MFMKKVALITAAAAMASMLTVFPSASVYAETVSSAASSKANDNEEAAMTKALKLVKSRVTIPAEYSAFSFTTSVSHKMKSYNFVWQIPNDTKGRGSYRVTLTGDIITRYSEPADESAPYSHCSLSLTDKTDVQMEKAALDFIYKLNPSMKGQLVKSRGGEVSLDSNNTRIYFTRAYKGVDVQGSNDVSVTLNKHSLKVSGFNCSWWQNAAFDEPSKALSQDKIKEIYRSEVDLEHAYRLDYDYETDKYTARVVYYPTDSYIYNAITGKHTTMYDDRSKAMETDGYDDFEVEVEEECVEEAAAPAAGVNKGNSEITLTEEEKKEIEKMKSMLTREQFKELLLKEPYIKVTKDYLLDRYEIYKDDDMPSGYVIDAYVQKNTKDEYCSYVICADAKSGKIYSFERNSNEELRSALNVKNANSLAEKAAKYYCGEFFSHYKPDESNSLPVRRSENYVEKSRTINFDRYENNILVENQYISIGVNSDGIVTSMNYNHVKDVDFGDGKIISENKAFECLFEQQDMELYYDGFIDLESKPHTYLHYSMPSWIINAKTGKLSDYSGIALANIDEKPKYDSCPYTDIANSPYKDEIIELYRHGIDITNGGDKLDPTASMTVRDVSNLMNVLGSGYYYSYDTGSIEDKKPVTRAEFARRITIQLNMDRCAKFKGIYKSPFTDVKDSSDYIGYITLAYAAGAIEKDSSGKFYPDKLLSREYALHCIYYYIENEMKATN